MNLPIPLVFLITIASLTLGAMLFYFLVDRPLFKEYERASDARSKAVIESDNALKEARKEEQIAWSMVSTVEGRETAIKAQAKVWKQKLNHIIAFIWGEPILTRTVEDICDFIAEMRKELAQERAINRATARMILADKKTIEEQAARIEHLQEGLKALSDANFEQHNFQAEMLKRGFGLIQSPIGFGIVNIPSGSTVVAHGETPAVALASAEAKYRGVTGLKARSIGVDWGFEEKAEDYPLKAFGMGCNNIAPNGSLSQMPAAN